MNVALYGGNSWDTTWLTPFNTFNAPKGIDYLAITSGSSSGVSCSTGTPCDLVLVADTNNNRLLLFRADQAVIEYGTRGTLFRPIGLAYYLKTSGGGCNAASPCDDFMLIADTYNDRILQVAVNDGTMTLRGDGTWHGSISNPKSFKAPHGVVFRYIVNIDIYTYIIILIQYFFI